jgi:hypothetical protein
VAVVEAEADAVASVVSIVLDVLVALTVLDVLTVLTVLDVITVSDVGEVNGSSKEFGYFMKRKCPCMTDRRGTFFLVKHKGQIKVHKMNSA